MSRAAFLTVLAGGRNHAPGYIKRFHQGENFMIKSSAIGHDHAKP